MERLHLERARSAWRPHRQIHFEHLKVSGLRVRKIFQEKISGAFAKGFVESRSLLKGIKSPDILVWFWAVCDWLFVKKRIFFEGPSDSILLGARKVPYVKV